MVMGQPSASFQKYPKSSFYTYEVNTALEVSVFGVVLARIFPHLD